MFIPSENNLLYHTERSVSAEMVDILTNSIVIEEYPSRVLLKIHGNHRIRCNIYIMKFKSVLPFALWFSFFLLDEIVVSLSGRWGMVRNTFEIKSYTCTCTCKIYSTDIDVAIIIHMKCDNKIL